MSYYGTSASVVEKDNYDGQKGGTETVEHGGRPKTPDNVEHANFHKKNYYYASTDTIKTINNGDHFFDETSYLVKNKYNLSHNYYNIYNDNGYNMKNNSNNRKNYDQFYDDINRNNKNSQTSNNSNNGNNNNKNNNRHYNLNVTTNGGNGANGANGSINARLYHNFRAWSEPANDSDSSETFDEKHNNQHTSIDTLLPVIVDNGSFRIKAGFMNDCDESKTNLTQNSNENDILNKRLITPDIVTPNLVGRKIQFGRKKRRKHSSKKMKIPLIGDEAHNKREACDLTFPIINGIIDNWDDIQTVWSYTFFTKLQIKCEDHPILMTESPFNTKEKRANMAEIMFETFNFPKLAIAMDAILELYHTGQTTGVTVSSGHNLTNIIPIYEGIPIEKAFNTLNIAGSTITDNLHKLLHERDLLLMTSSHREMSRAIKEKLGFVSLNYGNDALSENWNKFVKEYQLPDKSIIRVGNERLKCTESLFDPSLIGINDICGIHTLIDDSIQQAHNDMRSMFFKNIVVSGGNTLFPQFDKRLCNELETIVNHKYNSNDNNNNNQSNNSNNTNRHKNGLNKQNQDNQHITPSNMNRLRNKYKNNHKNIHVHVRSMPERKYGAWIGGSIVASLDSLSGMWVTKEEFDEIGTNIVHRKVLSSV